MFSVISRTLVSGRVLPLCRDAVGEFYSPNQLGHRTPFGGKESYPSTAMQSMYSTYPSQLGHRTLFGGKESYPSTEMQSVYSTAAIVRFAEFERPYEKKTYRKTLPDFKHKMKLYWNIIIHWWQQLPDLKNECFYFTIFISNSNKF